MELKQNLKQLRKSRGLTQQELADAIFVSRSAVAKWENGLGLPGEDSMKALENFFGISPTEIATTDPEAVIVKKNQRLRAILWTSLLAIAVTLSLCLPLLLASGDYGFTPETLAGPFADNPYIDTGDFRFYYSSFEGDWENGQHWVSLSHFKPVRRHFWGCTTRRSDYEYRIILHNNTMVGKIYSYKGKNGYYNLIMNTPGNQMRTDILTLTQVKVNGELYPVEKGFFFTTPNPVEAFWVKNAFMRVE